MNIFEMDSGLFDGFVSGMENIIESLAVVGKEEDLSKLKKLISDFRMKTEDFYRENRKLNIGVVGQVKAGKSSFLNTLLFEGKEILPKAATPKTATLTKMEYSEENIIEIEYYAPEEWDVLKDNAKIDKEDEIYTSAKEIMDMVRVSGLDPYPYLQRGVDHIRFSTYDELISGLNEYVGADGKFTPIIKAVTLHLNKEEFKDLSIVDTPGLNDPIASRTLRTKEFMEVCDVVFFLSQSGSFLDKSDWDLLSSQLPQKGVKRLVLIASKYDSGIRDILRKEEEIDDVFGGDENTASSIPQAYKIIRKKLRRRAKNKVEEFVQDLQRRGSSGELIDVIRQCSDPLMISSIAYNMSNKPVEDYSSEEQNIYYALKQFSEDIEGDLRLLGDFEEVRRIFDEVVKVKADILEQKAKSFVPNAKEEAGNLITSFKEKSEKRVQILESKDKEELSAQKKAVELQMKNIGSDIVTVFGEMNTKLETEKADAVRELREASKDYFSIREKTGTRTRTRSYEVSDAKWYNPFSWFSSHTEYETYTEHYSYCDSADAVENIRQFALEASNHVERIFTEAIELKELKRKLLNVVMANFDTGSENYDVAFFKIVVEDAVNTVEFPVFKIDIQSAMTGITSRFSGEITGSGKTELATALQNAISGIYDKICDRTVEEVKLFKSMLTDTSKEVEKALLENITHEFEELISQYKNKEKEIADYKIYIELLKQSLKELI